MPNAKLNDWVRQCLDAPERDIDRVQVRRALSIFTEPEQAFYLQSLPSGKWRECHGSDLDTAVDIAYELSDGQGVYFTLNPCKAHLDTMPHVGDVLCRRWFLIDADRSPIARKDHPGSNASQAEKLQIAEVVYRASDWLYELQWPNPVMVDSGNGYHLYYRVDLPNDPLSRQLLKLVLIQLKSCFETAAVEIDARVIDARRITKLVGTWARKGPHSEERPHRVAWLMLVPDPVEVVSLDQLRGLIPEPPTTIPLPPLVATPRPTGIAALIHGGSGQDLSHYVRTAIEAECREVETCPEGGRNDRLNVAAFNLGTMAGWPEMDAEDARGSLYSAACRSGLAADPNCGPAGIAKTIESGWTGGAAKPRPRPAEEPAEVQTPASEAIETLPAKLTVGLDEIVEEDVDWIYENVIAIGFISIFAGQTSQGKSFVVCDLIARLTRGDCFPFSNDSRPPSHVLMISEDPLEQMLGPRLNSMGAVAKSVRFLTWDAMAHYTLHDTTMLDRAYLECRQPILLVIDPPQNFLGKIDEHKNAEVRTVLMRVVAWLQKRLAACILIMHVNKQIGKGLAALDRIMGSVAWATTPRIAIGFTDDPDVTDQHIMAGIKNNLGPKAQALAYKIVPTIPKRAKIEWTGVLSISADDAMNAVKRKPVGVSAVEWISDRFREQAEWQSSVLATLAKGAGVSTDAIFKGDEVGSLPIKKQQRVDANGKRYWVWRAIPGWPPEKTDERSESAKV